MMRSKKIAAILFFLALISGVFLLIDKTALIKVKEAEKDITDNLEDQKENQQEEKAKKYSDESGDSVKKEEKITLPKKKLIYVPFTSQAPYAVWDEYHEEACEEASLIMVAYYIQNKKLNREIAEKEIQNLIDFQIEKYGGYKDSDAAGMIKLAADYYGIKNLKVVYDFEKTEIKKQLAKGKPIIIPAAGRKLGNPNFTYPGPLYHMLVLVGYDGNTIITNDPGTRKGEGYKYDIDVLFKAIHDFPGNIGEIEKGRKAMIIIE